MKPTPTSIASLTLVVVLSSAFLSTARAQADASAATLTAAQVVAVVADTTAFTAISTGARPADVVSYLVQIINALDAGNMAIADKRTIVSNLFSITTQTQGGAAPGIIAQVRARVSPSLLPAGNRDRSTFGRDTAGRGKGAEKSAPGKAPVYPGQ